MPTRKDNTNVAPIYREQVFIPASGTTLIKQKARPKFNGLPIASGAIDIVSPEFDLLTGIRGIANLPKGFLKTKGLPKSEELYYRQVARENNPLERAKNIGIVDVKSAPKKDVVTRSGLVFNFSKTFNVPFFSKGHLWYGYNPKYDVIVGKDNPLLDWKTITKHGSVTKPTISNPRRTPYYMGEANQAPTELFELYRHYPGLGYRNVTYGFPTIPITGLNTAIEQMKCGGRRKAQLGLDIQYGGRAIPISKDMVYFDGNKHEAGGIGVGSDLEVEGGEVGQRKGNSLRVFSSVPFLHGASPAQLVMGGANPDAVFKAQEKFKDRNRINDDGTLYENGGQRIIHINDLPSSFRGQYRRGNYVQIGIPPVASKAKTWNNTFKDHMNSLNVELKDFIIDGIKYGRNILPKPLKKYYSKFINILNSPGVEGVNNTAQKITQVQSMFDEKRAGGIYIKPNKRGTFTAAAKKRGMGVQEFASKVLANKDNYSPAMVKKANFTRNASRWKKEYGGTMIYTVNGNIKNGLSLRSKALFGTRKKFVAGGEDENKRKKNKDNFQSYNNIIVSNGITYYMDNDGTYVPIYDEPINANLGQTIYGGSNVRNIAYDRQGNRYFRRSTGELIRLNKKEVKEIEGGELPEVTVTGRKQYHIDDEGDVYYTRGNEKIYPKTKGNAFINVARNPHEAKKLLGYDVEIRLNEDGTYSFYNKEKDYWRGNRITYKDLITTEPIEAKEGKRSETKVIGSLVYEKDANGKWIPTTKTINDVTHYVRPGANNIRTIATNPLTGERINADNIVETEEPSVKGTTKINAVNSRQESSPRRKGTQVVTSQASTKSKATKTVQTVEQPAVMRREEYYSQPSVGENRSIADESYNTRQSRGLEAIDEYSPSSTGGGTKPKTNEIDEPLIGKFNPFTLTDVISGLGNMVGSTASYFINRNLIDKYPMPTKPIMTPTVKLKTRFDVSGDIADIEESRRIASDAYKRNTQSSAAYLSRLQTGLNTAYRQKAEARRYVERMTNQLINADLQNRQNVYARNVAAQNDYYNRLLDSRRAKSQLEMQNLNNLISGLTGGVTSLMSNIDTRANYNKTTQAIQAANPNVDPRLLGIYDYYEGAKTKRKYKKRDVING